MRKNGNLKGILILFLCAFIWGSAFVAQAEGMDLVSPFTFNGIRMLLGSAVLLPFILIRFVRDKKKTGYDRCKKKAEIKHSVRAGLIIGCVLTVASNLQQYSLVGSAPGKVAFITAFYMFLVPVFGLFMLKRRPAKIVWLCIAVGIAGLYLLCIGPGGIDGVNVYDGLALLCAVCYAVHILSVEKLGSGADAVLLSCVQFIVAGVVSCVLMFVFETPDIAVIKSCAGPIIYAGVLSSGVAFTLQIIGQKYAEPAVASIVMCFESVFGVLSSCVFYRTLPTAWESAGCIIMFAAIVISQLPELISSVRTRV